MNPNYEIYSALKDEIPAEDTARLDGYLRGREEADFRKLSAAEKHANEAELKRLREEVRRYEGDLRTLAGD